MTRGRFESNQIMKTPISLDRAGETSLPHLLELRANPSRWVSNMEYLIVGIFWLMGTPVQALQPEVVFGFQIEPQHPSSGLVQGVDGNLYGTIAGHEEVDFGSVFQVTTQGVVTKFVTFTGDNGSNPRSRLALDTEGNLYGTTESGGSDGLGTVFRVTPKGVLTQLMAFTGADGANPVAALTLGSDGNFYGTTTSGGDFDAGTVFRITTRGLLTTLASFNHANGAHPTAELVQGRDGNFYGTTYDGGEERGGTAFRVTLAGELISLKSFKSILRPAGGLVLGSDGDFYGTTQPPDESKASGTVFRITRNGVFRTLVSFSGTNGAFAGARLVLGADNILYGTTREGGSSGSGTVFRVTTEGVLTSLASFNGSNGRQPFAELVQARDGNFYGTTYYGGSRDLGTVFQITTNGELSSLTSFDSNNTNGTFPLASLALGSDGNLYGTTSKGGITGDGTIYKVTPHGELTSLVSFPFPQGGNCDGITPTSARLVVGRDGGFYGTSPGCPFHLGSFAGSVFRVTAGGVFTVLARYQAADKRLHPRGGLTLGDDGDLYGMTAENLFKITGNGVFELVRSFSSDNGGVSIAIQGLVLGRDHVFYGTTDIGGISSDGTVFKVTTNGTFTSLASFDYANGSRPQGKLVLGPNGDFYGTTSSGGSADLGTVFRVTANGVVTPLVSFNGDDGASPGAGLLLGEGGDLYGTTWSGGSSGMGTVFKLTTNGVLTSLLSFTGYNGAHPQGELIRGFDGNIYGTTTDGGPRGGGIIFRLAVYPHLAIEVKKPSGETLITGTGLPNEGYRLRVSTDLSLPISSWTLLQSESFDSNGTFSYTDRSAVTDTSRFYHVSRH